MIKEERTYVVQGIYRTGRDRALVTLYEEPTWDDDASLGPMYSDGRDELRLVVTGDLTSWVFGKTITVRLEG